MDKDGSKKNYKITDFILLNEEVLESWGGEQSLNRDGNHKFEKEFQTSYNSSFWELNIYARINDNKMMDEIIYDQTIRISNAFDNKYKRYKEKYREKAWVKDRPFIIALEPFDQPDFMITGSESIGYINEAV